MSNSKVNYASCIADTFPDPIAILDTKGTILWCNNALYEVSQLTPEDIIGHRFTKLALLRARDIPTHVKTFASVLRGKETGPNKVTWFRKDGTPINSEAIMSRIVLPNGKKAIQVITRDITKLRQTDERYTMFFQNSRVPLFRTDMKSGLVLECNKMGAFLFGYSSPEDLVGRVKVSDHYINPEDREFLIKELKMNGEVSNYLLHLRKLDESEIWVEISSIPYPEEGYLESVVIDVTDRHRAEEALKENQERLNLALKGADLGAWDFMSDTETWHVSERFAEIMEHPVEDLQGIGPKWDEIIHPDDYRFVRSQWDKHEKNELPMYSVEYRIITKAGNWKWVLDRGRIVEFNPDGSPYRASGTLLDITERKKAEDQLKASESRYRELIKYLPAGVGIADLDEHLLIVNPQLSLSRYLLAIIRSYSIKNIHSNSFLFSIA